MKFCFAGSSAILALLRWLLLLSSLNLAFNIHAAFVAGQPTWKCSKQGLCSSDSNASKSCASEPIVCPSKDCKAVRGYYDLAPPVGNNNINVVDADVNSHRKLQEGEAPAVTSAAECCAACKSNPKCNVWNYCWDTKGCGYTGACDGFNTYYKKGSKLRGKYGGSCNKDGRFPQNFCILRKASEYYEFKDAVRKGPHGPHSMTSGKLANRVVPQKLESGTWKCFLPLWCYVTGVERKVCPNEERTCPPNKCRPVRGLYEVSKVLDAETSSRWLPPKGGPYTSSPAECCEQCSKKEGCNVWNFCSDPKGCGPKGSCLEYNKKYPRGSTPFAPSGPGNIRGFFPSSCISEGRFPRYFCILRRAEAREFKTLKTRGSRSAFSWTSGKIG